MVRLLALFVLVFGVAFAQAQSGPADRATLVARTAKVRAQLVKDSVPMTTAQLDTLRVQAAAAVKPVVAIRLLTQALVLADSLHDTARERDVLFALSHAYRTSGKAADAWMALHAAHYLKDSLANEESARAAALAEERIAQEQRSLKEREAQQREERNVEREAFLHAAERARAIIIGAGVVIVLLLAGLLWTVKRLARLQRTMQVSEVKAPPVEPPPAEPKKNVLRTEVIAPPPIDSEEPSTADPEAAMLLALFHKRMPERLLALKEARSRNDHEKVLRVLASIRPQLAQHDSARFTDRCARLIAARDHVLAPEHAADLDRLLTDVQALLGAASSAK